MSAPQGWYDAGTPGRQRWWDGTQWGVQERETPPSSPATGWYAVPGTTDVRWWDGTIWTPYRFRAGKPRPDALAVEPLATGVFLGIFFLVLALVQLSGALITRNPVNFVLPVLLASVAVIWIVGAVQSFGLRRTPAPDSPPIVDAALQPLPGVVEGPGAAWYPMTAQVTRWWTGTRWSWYVGTRYGARPGHAGPRGYLVSMILGWAITGIAVIALLAAVIGGLVVQSPMTGVVVGIGVIMALIFGALGAFALLITRSRRNAMLLPSTPPPVR